VTDSNLAEKIYRKLISYYKKNADGFELFSFVEISYMAFFWGVMTLLS